MFILDTLTACVQTEMCTNNAAAPLFVVLYDALIRTNMPY